MVGRYGIQGLKPSPPPPSSVTGPAPRSEIEMRVAAACLVEYGKIPDGHVQILPAMLCFPLPTLFFFFWFFSSHICCLAVSRGLFFWSHVAVAAYMGMLLAYLVSCSRPVTITQQLSVTYSAP